MPEVEKVALPVPFAATGIPEPAAADAVHLLLGAVGVGCDLLPESDYFTELVVDDDPLVGVAPALQTFHLLAQRDVADLVDPNAHHVFLGADVPSVGSVVGVEVGENPPVADSFGLPVGVEP